MRKKSDSERLIFSQPKPQDNNLSDFYKHMNSLKSANYQHHENTNSDNEDDLETAQVEKKTMKEGRLLLMLSSNHGLVR